MNALWERPDFRRAAGDAWRPGGVELTRRALEWCAAAGALRPGALVLDLGSGAGATLRLLAQLGYQAVGLDKHAAAVLPGGADVDGCRFVLADMENPPLAEACLDCVLCECVLSLLQKPDAVLRSACRALRPGGLLVVGDIMLRPGYERPDAAGEARVGGCACAVSATMDEAGSNEVGQNSAVRNSIGSGQGAEDGSRSDHVRPDHVYTHDARPARHSAHGASCLAGARPESAWRGLVQAAGFSLLRYEDNSRALVELAARMIWYGDDAPRPAPGCACGGAAPGISWRAYGYGLWIARKETL